MGKLIDLLKYILQTYPKPEELSKPRIVKLIYLIDWKYAIDYDKQYTDITWIFNHYGPYVNDVINVMKDNPDEFEVKSRENPYGGITDIFKLNKKNEVNYEIDINIKRIADLLISKTAHLSWTSFISAVYSTYPVKTNLQYSTLNLSELAKEFRIKKLQPTMRIKNS